MVWSQIADASSGDWTHIYLGDEMVLPLDSDQSFYAAFGTVQSVVKTLTPVS